MKDTIRSRVVPVMLVSAAVAAMGVSVWTQIDQQRADERHAAYEACADRVLNDLITTLSDTRAVSSAERETTRALYADIAAQPRDFRARIGRYLAELERADEERARRPLPSPPAVACGVAERR